MLSRMAFSILRRQPRGSDRPERIYREEAEEIRIALEPGGSVRKKRTFAAKVTRLSAACEDVPAGSIKRGTYVVRVVSGFRPEPNSPYHDRLDAPLVVK